MAPEQMRGKPFSNSRVEPGAFYLVNKSLIAAYQTFAMYAYP